MTEGQRLQSLTRSESLRLLADVPIGRVVFTYRALPAIRPVNHIMDGERIIIRTDRESALARAVGPKGRDVVAYEADVIDPATHVGWSVIVVGRASRLSDDGAADRYRQVLKPWVAGTYDDILVIEPEMVDGFRLVASPSPDGHRP